MSRFVLDPMGEHERKRNQECQREHRAHWVVFQREGNASAFAGYHWTPSDYSGVRCDDASGGCGRVWRTKAAYVARLPDAPRNRTSRQ